MIIVLDHYTNSEESIKTLIKSFNKQLELKSTIGKKPSLSLLNNQ